MMDQPDMTGHRIDGDEPVSYGAPKALPKPDGWHRKSEVDAFRAMLDLRDAIDRIGKADSEDDHYYGAWSGGSKQEGGHPAASGGHAQSKPRKEGAAARKIQEDEAADIARNRARNDAATAATVKPEPVKLEPKDKPADVGQPAALLAFERDIIAKNPKVEWGQIFDKDGNLVTPPTKGTASRIRWPMGPRGTSNWVGASLTHLHPIRLGDSSTTAAGRTMSLSAQDVKVALDTRLGSIRAFTVGGDWMEMRNTGYAYNSTAFSMKFSSAWKTAQRGQWWSGPVSAGPDFRLASEAMFTAYRQTMVSVVSSIPGLEIRTGTL